MFTLQDNYLTLFKIVTEDYQYTRWYDRPLRTTDMIPVPLIKVSKGTVMPKHWIR